MNRRVRERAGQWLADARRAVVVEVTCAVGSVPREAGTRMLVGPEECVGTIGGGHLELKAIEHARAMLRRGDLGPHAEHFPLGPALGQCCGGAVTLAYRPLDERSLADWPESAPLFHLQLYGAGHVGRAIATLLATLDVVVDWIDERESEFPSAWSPGTPWPAQIRRVCVDGVEGEVAAAPAGACYLVLTHRHDLDLRITEAILERGDFAFLGLIGSKTKRQRFIHRFEARGIPPARIARLTCPIGLPAIAGKEPAVIAAAVVAQLLTVTSPPPAAPERVAQARAAAG